MQFQIFDLASNSFKLLRFFTFTLDRPSPKGSDIAVPLCQLPDANTGIVTSRQIFVSSQDLVPRSQVLAGELIENPHCCIERHTA